MPAAHIIPVSETSRVAEARRLATRLAREAGLSETEAGQAAIVATEAAGNLLKHAREGRILIQMVEDSGAQGVEILAFDKGPGLADPEACLRDGFSTGGTPGTGLGAIQRLSSEFDLYSVPGKGTVLMSRIWPSTWRPGAWRAGAVCVPCPGEEACGDGWCWTQQPGRVVAIVADGLGHGVDAATAAREAARLFGENAHLWPAEIVERIHSGLRKTRGAVVGVAQVDRSARTVRFCGLGNIAASILHPGGSKQMVSYDGIAGHSARKIQEFQYLWPENAPLLVLASDGIATRWDLGDYPGLTQYAPSVIAAVLYRDFERGRDDATVVVVK